MIRIMILLLAAFGAYTLYKTYVGTLPNTVGAHQVPGATAAF